MLIALTLLACGPADTTEEGPLDARLEYPAPSEGGVGWVTPDYEVAPYTDIQFCTVFTYEGDDAGVIGGQFLQNRDYGHHTVILVSNEREEEIPDGSVWECTETHQMRMENTEPLLFGNQLSEGLAELVLPDGLAVKLRAGSRILMQSHYINATDEPVLLNDAINLDLIPADDVETWTAPWIHIDNGLDLPPGESTVTIDCEFDQELNLLSMLGHMHEWGTSFSVEQVHEDGSTELLYDIPEWDVSFRDLAPTNEWAPGEFTVRPGDRFRTTCNYYNDTADNLGFPEEMCVSVGMAYPAVVPVMCEPN